MFLIFLFNYIVYSQTPNYCKISDGIKITQNNDCLMSEQYNVQNCCFECFQYNPINQSSTIKCGSLYALGFTSCTPQAQAAAQKACGGTTNSYICFCNPGNDKSQINGLVPISSSINLAKFFTLFVITFIINLL